MASPSIIPFYFKVAWRHKKLFIAVSILGPTTMLLADYVMPLFIAWVLSHIQTGTITLQNSWWIIALFALTEIYCQVFAWRLNLRLMWKMQIEGAIYLYRLAYKKLTQHSIDFYANTFTGSLVSNVNRFAGAFMDFWNTYTFTFILIITSLFATIIGLAFVLWQYALILLALAIIFIVCAYFGTRYIRARYVKRSEAYTEISGNLSDSIGNILTVKADARERSEEAMLNASLNNMRHREADTRNSFIRATTIYGSVTSLIRISVLVTSIWAVQSGIANAAIVYISLTYTFNLISQLWNVSGLLRSYYQITGDSTKMLDIIETPPAIVDRTKRRLKLHTSDISFDDISFTHPAAESDEEEKNNNVQVETLFEHFSLTIKNHQKIGLVGVSGSGKSTLLKLLMRFYDVDGGKIMIDGQDISRVTQASLHEAIAYVPQEPLLFHRSILENISYARPGATFEQIYEAAKSANALEFIEKLPNKFETLVGERGVKLSGGQRQRIAIARAILKDAPLLILDEATSALDSESEAFIQDALTRLMKDRTSIVIAHRLSTIAKLDRIVVLENGNIIEDGSHTALLKKSGIYAKLWAHQSGGFLDAKDQQ